MLPAPNHLSPSPSALPLAELARAWERFTCASLIYVAVRAWYRWRREVFTGSHWSNGNGNGDLRLTQEGAPAGRHLSELHKTRQRQTPARDFRGRQDVGWRRWQLKWSHYYKGGTGTRPDRRFRLVCRMGIIMGNERSMLGRSGTKAKWRRDRRARTPAAPGPSYSTLSRGPDGILYVWTRSGVRKRRAHICRHHAMGYWSDRHCVVVSHVCNPCCETALIFFL